MPPVETFELGVAKLDVVLDVLLLPPPTIFGAQGSGVSEAGDASAAVDWRSTDRWGPWRLYDDRRSRDVLEFYDFVGYILK